MSKGIALAGDLHLSRAIYHGKLPNMVGDSLYALTQIADYCRSYDLDLVLLGDNFDKRFPEGDIVAAMLHRISGIDVCFVQGQHDFQTTGWPGVEPYANGKRIHLDTLDECVVMGNGINVFGYDYTPRHLLEERLKHVPDDCDVLCLHQLNDDVMKLEDSWTLQMGWVPSHVKVTAMGDWHGLPQDGVTDGRRWLYTGSSTVRAVGEPLNKSFVVCIKALNGNINFERIPLHTRAYIYNDLVWADDLDKWLSKIVDAVNEERASSIAYGMPTELIPPLVVCRYNVEIDSAYDRIQDKLAKMISAGELYLHLMPNRKFVPDAPDYVEAVGQTVSIQSAINEAVDKDMSPVLHDFVSDLANNPDPKAVITAFKTKHQVVDDPSAMLPTHANPAVEVNRGAFGG